MWQGTREKTTFRKGIIHIVDDEQDIVSIATKALEQEGFTVHPFTSPSEALKDIEGSCMTNVSMLITDVRMPEHSGFDVARRTRAVAPDVSVIFMTAFEISPAEFRKMFPSFEVNEFLPKPFRVQKLVDVVRKYQS